MTWVLAIACALAAIPAGLRWLRVAQREHYLSPAVTRFAVRWWTARPANWALIGLAVIGTVGAVWSVWLGFLAAVAQIGPFGLSPRGVSSPLAWTPRLRRLCVVSAAMVTALFVVAGTTGVAVLAPVAVVGLPVVLDMMLFLLGPLESRLGRKWVDRAARKLSSLGVEVVAITGSYGKTTTKGYIAHLLAGTRRTVASPASFNNRMGLARAINEGLTPGSEVFVAEMGTYGPGEIAALCRWIPPKVAALISVGPVHLERFKTEERIVAAKSEILDRAEMGVICVDHPLLARLAEDRARAMELIEVSTGDVGRVQVADGIVRIDGTAVAPAPAGVFPDNLAVAIGVCLALGVGQDRILPRLSDLPVAEHRQAVLRSERGFSIIDNTFNSNPAAARSALGLLGEVGVGGKRVVVTPGMVELGRLQTSENLAFASEAARVAHHLVIVGRTNRKALLAGSSGDRPSVTVVDSRDQAVAWVRENLGPGDAVLYENDLPDHYP